MQLIHLTYTWSTPESDADLRHQKAIATWRKHADPQFYREMHLKPEDLLFHGHHMNDPDPYPILKHLVNRAFSDRRSDQDVILFTNSDIQLHPQRWNILQKRIENQQPHYEDTVHTRKLKPGEATSDPINFLFPYRWWIDVQKYIAPVFFACPYWEPTFQFAIDRSNPERPKYKPFTLHEPHLFFKRFGVWRLPCRMFNHAIVEGWSKLRYDIPDGFGSLRIQRAIGRQHAPPTGPH